MTRGKLTEHPEHMHLSRETCSPQIQAHKLHDYAALEERPSSEYPSPILHPIQFITYLINENQRKTQEKRAFKIAQQHRKYYNRSNI